MAEVQTPRLRFRQGNGGAAGSNKELHLLLLKLLSPCWLSQPAWSERFHAAAAPKATTTDYKQLFSTPKHLL